MRRGAAGDLGAAALVVQTARRATLHRVKFATLLLLMPVLALPQDPIKVSFEVLAGYEHKAGEALPAKVTAYDGKVVSIGGFMMREVPGSGPVNQFLLVNEACGCNGTPKLNEIVFCALPEGVTMEVPAGIVHVTGKLFVGEQKEEGEIVALYTLDADEVK